VKALITGIGGSIGVHMLDHIMINTDWDVVGIDSYRHKGHFDRVAQTIEHNPGWNERVTLITHDLTAPFTEREVEKVGYVDYVINLASLADVWDSVDDPVPFVRNNTEIVLTMLELARELKPKAFVQFSTDEVYGPADVDQGHPEWATLVPSNPYSASKACQEMIAISYWRTYGVPVIITNTMNNYGQFQGSSKYPVIIQRKLMAGEEIEVHAAGDGQIGTRYYIHSRNVADAVLFILKNTTPYMHQAGMVDKPDKYNIVGSAQVDNLEMAKVIARLMDKPLKYKLVNFHEDQPGHDLHYGLDGTKLGKLGWKPPVGFEESMKATIDWQLEHPEWISEDA
jgi:dTDP-D-glucose 4,6-dehydratase